VEKRKFIHIDMDAFFASVEQRDNPQYRGRAVIVGGSPDKRGVVAACSYEARKFGIHSAMSSAMAQRLCRDAVFLKPRFDAYRTVSNQLHTIFKTFTDQIEPLSLDEAFLDVTECSSYQGSATLIARSIKQQIKQYIGLIASAGISYNKFLAKIASDMDKPDGFYLIKPGQGVEFIARLPIRKFYGIGRATEAKMKKLGIHTGAELKKQTRDQLISSFGKSGHYFYDIARGIDNRPVKTSRIRKSLGTETTFENDLVSIDQMLEHLERLADKVILRLEDKNLSARTITLKVKFADFELMTRSRTLEKPITGYEEMMGLLPGLLNKTDIRNRNVRLLGITTSNLEYLTKEKQINLFV